MLMNYCRRSLWKSYVFIRSFLAKLFSQKIFLFAVMKSMQNIHIYIFKIKCFIYKWKLNIQNRDHILKEIYKSARYCKKVEILMITHIQCYRWIIDACNHIRCQEIKIIAEALSNLPLCTKYERKHTDNALRIALFKLRLYDLNLHLSLYMITMCNSLFIYMKLQFFLNWQHILYLNNAIVYLCMIPVLSDEIVFYKRQEKVEYVDCFPFL